MPNDQSVDFDRTKYRTSVRAVEQLTGYKFFPDVPEEAGSERELPPSPPTDPDVPD
jgi:DNA/RNA endonuclease G (NUC1)